MYDMKFDYIGLSETSRNWPSLKEEGRTPQRFRGHFMSQQVDLVTAYNKHGPFLDPFQYGGTASLYTRNPTGRKMASGKDPSGIGIWCW